jgi:phosphopentomutase
VHTANAALAYWRNEVPRLSFVSLGDTDEYAHADDYRAYLAALQRADAFVGRAMALVLQRIAAGQPTTLLVTTDHGRARGFTNHGARFPESARIWLAAMGSGIGARGHVVLTRPHYLADIAPTLRLLLGLRAQSGPDQGRALGELRLRAASAMALSALDAHR